MQKTLSTGWYILKLYGFEGGMRDIAISLIFTHDHIVGSSVELIEVMCFLKFTADQVMEFYWIAGSSISQIIRTKLKIFTFTLLLK